MTLTSVRLADSLQALIDSRLDTIERMLMGRVSRQDRLAIVKDVEAQIFDLLSEQATDEPTREDVLAALARLDPPEAYLPEAGETADDVRVGMAPGAVTPRSVTVQPSRAKTDPRLGKISGILSLSMLGLAALSPFVLLMGETMNGAVEYLILFGWLAIIFQGGTIGFVLACVARFRSGWAILGGILSPILILSSLVATVFLMIF